MQYSDIEHIIVRQAVCQYGMYEYRAYIVILICVPVQEIMRFVCWIYGVVWLNLWYRK